MGMEVGPAELTAWNDAIGKSFDVLGDLAICGTEIS